MLDANARRAVTASIFFWGGGVDAVFCPGYKVTGFKKVLLGV